MSLSRPLEDGAGICCDICTKTFSLQTNFEVHLQHNNHCRLQRAIKNLKRRREEGLPPPPPPRVEARPISTDIDYHDTIDFVAIDDDVQVNQQNDSEEELPEERVWDSTEQFVAWIKRAGLTQSQTDDMINLLRDQRMSVREALQNIQSHRDVDRYLMSVIVGEVGCLTLMWHSSRFFGLHFSTPGNLR